MKKLILPLTALSLTIATHCNLADAVVMVPTWTTVSSTTNGVIQESATRVSVITVNNGTLSNVIEIPATVRGNQTIDLYSKVGGFVESVSVDIGDKVAMDQVLAQLDIPEMETELVSKESMIRQAEAEHAQAEAALQETEAKLEAYYAAVDEANTIRAQKQALANYENRELQRLSQLANSGAIRRELIDSAQYKALAAQSDLKAVDATVATAQANLRGAKAGIIKAKADIDAARSRVDVAKANADHTRALMNYATIRAPWDGLVTKRMFDAGAFVQSAAGNSAAKPIFQLARTDIVRVTFALSTSNISGLNKGDRAVLHRIEAIKGAQFEGAVSRFSAGLDANTRMMQVEVDLPNPDSRLKPGYFGYVQVFLQDYKDVPVVPSAAVVGEGENAHVFLVRDGAAVKKRVTVGFDNGKQAAIVEGISAGQSLISNVPSGLSNGDAVRVK